MHSYCDLAFVISFSTRDIPPFGSAKSPGIEWKRGLCTLTENSFKFRHHRWQKKFVAEYCWLPAWLDSCSAKLGRWHTTPWSCSCRTTVAIARARGAVSSEVAQEPSGFCPHGSCSWLLSHADETMECCESNE